MRKLGYDAFALGNHEFDNGVEVFIFNWIQPWIHALVFCWPFCHESDGAWRVAYSDTGGEYWRFRRTKVTGHFQTDYWIYDKRSQNWHCWLSDRRNTGYIRLSWNISFESEFCTYLNSWKDTGKLKFENVVETVKKYTQELRDNGCQIVIGVGHYGYQVLVRL